MRGYRQDIETELAGMVIALVALFVIASGLTWAAILVSKWFITGG